MKKTLFDEIINPPLNDAVNWEPSGELYNGEITDIEEMFEEEDEEDEFEEDDDSI